MQQDASNSMNGTVDGHKDITSFGDGVTRTRLNIKNERIAAEFNETLQTKIAQKDHIPGEEARYGIRDFFPARNHHQAIYSPGTIKYRATGKERPVLTIAYADAKDSAIGDALQTIKALARTWRDMGLEIIPQEVNGKKYEIGHRHGRENEPGSFRITLAPKEGDAKSLAVFEWLKSEFKNNQVARWQARVEASRDTAVSGRSHG
ncbi:MAG: hypothetical protein KGJ06_01500 [Pseudomonadota bacterium]|nr:hypothetical protein [Pseudomonadota bacterium]